MFDAWIRDHARMQPGARAVVTPDGAVSYAAFDADIDAMAAHLAARGVGPDAGVVSIAIGDGYRHLVALAALARLGAPSSPPQDARAALRLTDAGLGAGDPFLGLGPDWRQAATGAGVATPASDADGLARVLLSSGTTGEPRRVPLSWARIEASVAAALRIYGRGRLGLWIPFTGVSSLFGNIMALTAWSVGAAVAVGLRLRGVVEALEREPAGVLGVTPGALADLLSVLPPQARPRPGWRVVSCGATLPIPLGRAAARRMTPDVVINYGATEHTFIAAGPFAALDHTHGAVGWTPAGAAVELVEGELRVRGPRASSAYLDDSVASAARFGPDGWLTGDLGRRAPDAALVLQGRIDDRMTLEGGRKLAPAQIEDPALALAGVLDCAAFGVPGPGGLDGAWLAVVAEPGFDRGALVQALGERPDLPPVTIAWMTELPRNAMGKVLRGRLREAVQARLTKG